MIFFGPGSLSNERRPTPQTNAMKWGITSVTDGAIAFAAIMVRQLLFDLAKIMIFIGTVSSLDR